MSLHAKNYGIGAAAAAGALAIGAELAQAQTYDDSGGDINVGGGSGGTVTVGGGAAPTSGGGDTADLGASISDTVQSAVSGIATNGGTVSGGTQTQTNELELGEQQGLAISDASGGNYNVSFVS